MKDYSDLIGKSVYVRNALKLDPVQPINIFDELRKKDNYTIVFVPLSENIRGFSHKEKDHYIIIINANDTEPQKNFSCAHELYHLYFNYDADKTFKEEPNGEKRADKFAGYFLITQIELNSYLQENNIDTIEMTDLQLCGMERYFGVSRAALVYRLKEEGLIDKFCEEKYLKSIKKGAAKSGFDTKYYEKNEDSFNTEGEYIRLAEELFAAGKITRGKFNSYMLEAFRPDLIYNLEVADDSNKG